MTPKQRKKLEKHLTGILELGYHARVWPAVEMDAFATIHGDSEYPEESFILEPPDSSIH